MKLKIKKLHPDAITPKYATDGSGCFDFYALVIDGKFIHPQSGRTIRTGLAFEIPEGHVMLIFSRSGHGFKNDVRLANCVGVIDSDYRYEVMVRLTCDNENDGYEVKPYERIAQGMIVPIPKIEFEEVDSLSETERVGGFGSTGK